MSKKSVVNRNIRRQLMSERRQERRQALKKTWLDESKKPGEREYAYMRLQKNGARFESGARPYPLRIDRPPARRLPPFWHLPHEAARDGDERRNSRRH